ncbi:hypothetical protein D2Q93_10130 [Alicyclobacillaceae bacterium I2511]|nr:hypothetical protein D2Q93_10130 [Alicyclobacillaceae bacterium I2511]
MFPSSLSNKASLSVQRVQRFRDLTLIFSADAQVWVVACDGVGGIGQQPADAVAAHPTLVGHFALRVPLMEVLAAGAWPVAVTNTLTSPRGDYSAAIVAALRDLGAQVGLTNPEAFNGSTEDNVPTVQTGVGVTVLAVATRADLALGSAHSGQQLGLVGLPKSAPKHTIILDDPEMVSLPELLALRQLPGVSDIVPVGSRGIYAEVEDLAASAGLGFEVSGPRGDWTDSGGPSSCAVFACDSSAVAAVGQILHAPLAWLGTLR